MSILGHLPREQCTQILSSNANKLKEYESD